MGGILTQTVTARGGMLDTGRENKFKSGDRGS